MFDITFCPECPDDSNVCHGVIRLNGFSELFECPLDYWGQEDYRSQWHEGVVRVIDKRLDSCLITSLTNPSTANFLLWWPMYVAGAEVVIQNQAYFFGENETEFNIECPYHSLSPRRSVSEDGAKISEWIISMSDLRQWANAQRPGSGNDG